MREAKGIPVVSICGTMFLLWLLLMFVTEALVAG